MKPTEQQAWADFWTQDRQGRQTGGCLTRGGNAIEQAQRKAWQEIARFCPKGARVLDVATGDARVLQWLRAVRADLKLTGIDAAPNLPKAPAGCKVRGGVAMERLPFADRTFDLVTSQFGFEYSDVARTSCELARVLVPNGKAALLVHRGDGPILAQNRRRRDAISWVLQDRRVLEIAGNALVLPATAQNVANRLAAIASEGATLFGQSSPAWEITEAARQSLMLALPNNGTGLATALRQLQTQASNELARIAPLERASGVADRRAALLETLLGAGLMEADTTPIAVASEPAFADFILLNRLAEPGSASTPS